MSEIICLECGDRNNSQVQFCNSCGAYLEWDESVAESTNVPPTPSAPVAPTSVPHPPVPSQTASSTSHPGPTPSVGPRPTSATNAQSQPPGSTTPSTSHQVASAAGHLAAQAAAPLAARALGAGLSGVGRQVVPGWASRAGAEMISENSSAARATPSGAQQPTHQTAVQQTGIQQSATNSTPQPEPAEPQPEPCTRCSTINEPQLRFCRKCGLSLRAVDPTTSPAPLPEPAIRLPWWRRWWRRGSQDQSISNGLGRRAARAAYRRSLPLSYRLRRWAIGLVVVGLLGGSLFFLNRNPWSWLADRWNDLRGSLVEVGELQAAVEPEAAEFPEFPASLAVDQLANTAWVTTWIAPAVGALPADLNCLSPASTASNTDQGTLLLLLPQPTDVRAIIVSAGLAEQDPSRPHQWRPKTLQLTFTDGQCQNISLADMAGPQQLEIEKATTTAVRVRVLESYPASGTDGRDLVAISEMQLLARP